MRDLVMGFLRGYAFMAGFTIALLALTAALLFGSGAMTTEKVSAAWTALREGPPPPPPEVPEGMEEEWRTLRASRARATETLEKREADLRGLEELTSARLARIDSQLAELERQRAEAAREMETLKKARAEAAEAEADAELRANLPIFAKMDGAALLDLMKTYDDARIVRYLRALKPSRSAEVLEAMLEEPRFEEEFRTVPKGADPGTPTRAERIMEAFKRTPE